MNILEQIQQMLHCQDHYDPPDAVCMTRDRYDALVDVCTPYLVAVNNEKNYKESVFGLRIFIDDISPISYVEIGKAWIFNQRLNANKEKSAIL